MALRIYVPDWHRAGLTPGTGRLRGDSRPYGTVLTRERVKIYRWRTKDGVVHKRKSDNLRLRYMCIGGSNKGCPKPAMYAKTIEKVVWETVAKFLAAPEQISTLLETRQQELASGTSIEALDQALHRLSLFEAERGRRLSQHSKGYITDQELDLIMREVNERLEYHQEELSRLEAEANQTTEAIDQLQSWMDGYRRIVGRLDCLTDAERAEVVSLVVDRVTVVGRELQIRMVLDSRRYAASEPHHQPAYNVPPSITLIAQA